MGIDGSEFSIVVTIDLSPAKLGRFLASGIKERSETDRNGSVLGRNGFFKANCKTNLSCA